MPSEFTAAQRAALSFAALVNADAPWRDIAAHRLSFTEPGRDPLTQLYGSVAAGLAKCHVHPGSAAGRGFGALDGQDAAELLAEWRHLLARGPDDSISFGPSARKEPPP